MIVARGRQVLEIEAKAILSLMDRLDERFERAVHILHECRGRTIVTGMGKSGLIGRKIAATLASIGAPSAFLHPAEGIHGDLGMISRGDAVIALSNSGETEELLAIIPAIKRLNLPLISLTGNARSSLAKASDVVLDERGRGSVPAGPRAHVEYDRSVGAGRRVGHGPPRTPRVRPEDFARYHPGGALGRRLLLTVGN
jgi:arabinose-5-phosphate isomerase